MAMVQGTARCGGTAPWRPAPRPLPAAAAALLATALLLRLLQGGGGTGEHGAWGVDTPRVTLAWVTLARSSRAMPHTPSADLATFAPPDTIGATARLAQAPALDLASTIAPPAEPSPAWRGLAPALQVTAWRPGPGDSPMSARIDYLHQALAAAAARLAQDCPPERRSRHLCEAATQRQRQQIENLVREARALGLAAPADGIEADGTPRPDR